MPAGDGTGPMGMGPMTGRGTGYCGGYEAPGYANPWPRMGMAWRRGRGGRFGGWGGGWGLGWGRGRGWRAGYYGPYRSGYGFGYAPPAGAPPAGYGPYAPPSAEDEVAYLRTQAEWLRDTLESITSRIEELERSEA